MNNTVQKISALLILSLIIIIFIDIFNFGLTAYMILAAFVSLLLPLYGGYTVPYDIIYFEYKNNIYE